MPTLSLIVGVLVADRRAAGKGQDARQAGKPVDDLFFRLGAGMSVLYLLLVALSVLVQPLLPQATPLELMQRSNLWLGPLQGLTRSEEHTSELQSLMRISYAVFCLKKKKK